ncbi:MAG: hypothetical protein V1733_02855 [bacterium]
MKQINQEIWNLIEYPDRTSRILPGEGFNESVLCRLERRKANQGKLQGFVRENSGTLLITVAVFINLVSIGFGLRSILFTGDKLPCSTHPATEVYYIDPSPYQMYTYF